MFSCAKNTSSSSYSRGKRARDVNYDDTMLKACNVCAVRIAYSYICFPRVFLIERTEVKIGWEIRIILKPCDLVSGLQIVWYGGKKVLRMAD